MREIGSSAAGSGGGRVGVGRARRGVRGPARASCGRTGSSGAVGDGELCRWAFDARAVRRATFRKSHVTIGGGRRARARRPHAATAGMGTHLRMTGRNAAAEECVAKLCTANMSTERRVRRGARAE